MGKKFTPKSIQNDRTTKKLKKTLKKICDAICTPTLEIEANVHRLHYRNSMNKKCTPLYIQNLRTTKKKQSEMNENIVT